MDEATYFLEKADELVRLAKYAREKNAHDEICKALEELANEFMARAVEIDAARVKAAKIG